LELTTEMVLDFAVDMEMLSAEGVVMVNGLPVIFMGPEMDKDEDLVKEVTSHLKKRL
jgi:hypothetical protein